VRRIVCLLGSKYAMVVSFEMVFLIFTNAFSSSLPQQNLVSYSFFLSTDTVELLWLRSFHWRCRGGQPYQGNCALLPFLRFLPFFLHIFVNRGVGTGGRGVKPPKFSKVPFFRWQSALLTTWKMSLRSPFASTAFDLRLHLF
jgi:hypothetical protein